jgi:hypothetical protein
VVARNDPVGFHGCSDSLSAAQMRRKLTSKRV